MKRCLSLVLCSFCSLASAGDLTVSRALQLELLEEAKSQKAAAIAGRKAFEVGGNYQAVEKPLYTAFHRWRSWPAPDVVKDAMGSCASAVSDELGLITALRGGGGPEFVQQKRRYVKEDLEACDAAISNPERAFQGIQKVLPTAIVDRLSDP